MKYYSIDIETTGLDPIACQILSVACVMEDTLIERPVDECPFALWRVKRQFVKGEPYAIHMNAALILDCLEQKELPGSCYVSEDTLWYAIEDFIRPGAVKVTMAGKNISTFDFRFFCRLQGFSMNLIHRRMIDAGNLFIDFKRDSIVPDTKECNKRAGIAVGNIHNELWDARNVIMLLRTKY